MNQGKIAIIVIIITIVIIIVISVVAIISKFVCPVIVLCSGLLSRSNISVVFIFTIITINKTMELSFLPCIL